MQKEGAIELKNVSVIYENGSVYVKALNNISLTIEKSEKVAIVGKSGSGKSTLLNVISGIEKISEGEITFDNKKYNNMKESEMSKMRLREFGFVFQAFHLISSLTVWDNICLPVIADNKKVDSKFIESVLEKLELTDRKNHYPNQLSGGEKQRVALARAVINKPAILFADEPSGNLDTANGDKVFELMFDLAEQYGQTLVYVTHDMEKAALAERIITIKDGEIICDKRK